jgi:hypothetical protein
MKKWIKADEMEMSINFKAIRAAWIYSLLFLAIWNIVSVIRTGSIEFEPSFLLSTSMFIMLTVKSVLTKKMSGDKDNDE